MFVKDIFKQPFTNLIFHFSNISLIIVLEK
jgi:hypothetical protein